MNVGVAVLGDRGVVEMSGLDARAFLQRLVTNDVDNLAGGEARYAALLSPQGKILADFFVLADRTDPNRFLLDVPGSLAAELVKRLTQYRLRAKVDIRDRSEELGVFALDDRTAVPVDTALVFADPRAPGLWRRAIASRPALDHLGDDAARWAYREQRIRAGVPDGGIDFAYGETFPHEANLDRLHGVDFRKGCYVGQEVVSRVEHRGTARKRVVGVRFEGEPPSVGAEITAGGVELGTMGSTVDGLGLGLIRLDRAEDVRRRHGTVLAGSVPVELEGPGWA